MSKHGITHTTPNADNIFADLGFDPIEAANLKLRAEAMAAIEQWIADTGESQRVSAISLVASLGFIPMAFNSVTF